MSNTRELRDSQHGRHVCTPTEAMSEQQEAEKVMSTLDAALTERVDSTCIVGDVLY